MNKLEKHTLILLAFSFLMLCISVFVYPSVVNGYLFNIEVGDGKQRQSRSVQNLFLDESETGVCLDFPVLDQIITDFSQFYVVFPAKAAGSSLKFFAHQCNNYSGPVDNFINNPDALQQVLSDRLEPPKLIAGHLTSESTMSYLLDHATTKSLIVYVHREETDRTIASIKTILEGRTCKGLPLAGGKFDFPADSVQISGNKCILSEETVIAAVKANPNEVRAATRLTCNTFEKIRENRPSMIILNFRQASKLQNLLSNHICPWMHQPDIKVNVAAEKTTDVQIRLKNPAGNQTTVALGHWLELKRNILEVALGLNERNLSCRGVVRSLEDLLFDCPDQMIKASALRQGIR